MKTLNEFLVATGLDFTITKQPLYGKDNSGNDLITPYYGLFNENSGECINTCKEGYTVSQNAEIVEMVMRGTKTFGSDLELVKGGSINGGRRVYLQLAISGDGKVGDDTVKRYVTIIDSNDGSTGLSVGIGDIVMHCENQFFKFYKSGEAKFRHTATLEKKIQTIPFLVETALGKSLRQIELYNRFQSTAVSKELADSLVRSMLGYDRLMVETAEFKASKKLTSTSITNMETLYENIKFEQGIVGENVWGLFNGATRYTTHHQKTPKRNNGREESLITGRAYDKAISAFELCSTLV